MRRSIRTRIVGAAVGAALTMSLMMTASAAADTVLVVKLTGAAEVANGQLNAGDADGRGTIVLRRTTVTGANDRLCWTIVTHGIVLPASAGHIHGPAGRTATAAPVLDFSAANDAAWPRELPEAPGRSGSHGKSATGQGRGCAEYPDTTLNAVWTNLSQYYVNIHNAPFPGGAVRGQLG